MVAAALAVDENLGAVISAVEMPEHALAGERRRDIHQATVEADVTGGDGAFLVRKHRKALDLPVCGDGDSLPVGVGRTGGGEGRHGRVGGQFAPDGRADGAAVELETPGARHRQDGGIVHPQLIDGDGLVAGHRHRRRKGRRRKNQRRKHEGKKQVSKHGHLQILLLLGCLFVAEVRRRKGWKY